MADETRNVDFKLRAFDETGKAVNGAMRTMDDFGRWMANKAKEFRKENVQSGEKALGSALGLGGGGPSGFVGNALGLGVKGMLIEYGAKQAEAMTGKMVEVRNQMQEGKAGWGDLIEQTLGSAPFGIGEGFKTGRNISELFTGDDFKIKQQDEMIKLEDHFRQTRHDLFEGMKRDRITMQETVYASGYASKIASMWQRPEDQTVASMDVELARISRNVPNQQQQARNEINLRSRPALMDASDLVAKTKTGYLKESSWDNFEKYTKAQNDQNSLTRKVSEQIDLSDQSIHNKAEGESGVIDAKKAQFLDEQTRAKRNAIRQGNDQILDDLTKFNAKRLDLEGHYGEAERVVIARDYQKQITESQRRMEEDVRLHAGDSNYIGARRVQEQFNQIGIANRAFQAIGDANYADTLRQRSIRDTMQDFQVGMMNRVMDLPGAVATPEMKEIQYRVQQRIFERDTKNQLDDFLKTNPGQKDAVDQARGTLSDYMKDAMSPATIRRAGFGAEGPLVLPGYDPLPAGWKGLADASRSSDLSQQTMDLSQESKVHTELFKRMADALDKIAESAAKTADDPPQAMNLGNNN